MKKIALLLLVASFTLQAYAGGFQVSLQGTRQLGMGHVGTALSFDASAVYFNPGTLCMSGKLFSANVGFSPIFSRIVYSGGGASQYQASQVPQMGTPFNAYVSFTPGNLLKRKLALGMGIYTPFGSGSKWEDDWKGRYIVQSVALATIFYQPTISYRINKKLGVGFGFIFATGSLELRKAVPIQTATSDFGQATLSGKAKGKGFNIGIHYQANEKLNIGFNYKSKVKVSSDDGDATFNVPSSVAANFPNTIFATEITLPQIMNVGATYKVSEKLMIAGELNYTGWSSYDTLKFDFLTNTSSLKDSKSTKAWKNTFTIRVGSELQARKNITLRGGFYYDMSAARGGYVSPETPDANKVALTMGASYKIGAVSIDAALLYASGAKVNQLNPETNFDGTFKAKAVAPSIGIRVDLNHRKEEASY
jgi:long-chain fatty acid transport protein